jgi:hypothetical protein
MTVMDDAAVSLAVPAAVKCFVGPIPDRVEGEEALLAALPDAVDTIMQWAQAGDSRILIHCASGISRSPTVVIAFLMRRFGMPLMEAYEAVFQARPCINPNDGFVKALYSYGLAILPGKTVGDLDDIWTRYNAFQLASQLQFLSVTVEQAAVALKARNGNVEQAASDLLGT